MLTKYAPRGPSSRYRFLQFLPNLSRAGIQTTVAPLFDDFYIDCLFSGRSTGKVYLLKRVIARLTWLLRARRYDLVWIEGELIPFLPGGWERLLHGFLPPRVYDFDDAIWLRYQGKPKLENKFATILSNACGITAGNSFLAEYTGRFCSNVHRIPTVIDETRYPETRAVPKEQVIGWMGSPSTIHYLEALIPVFQKLVETRAVKLHVVGAKLAIPGVKVENIEWKIATEVAEIKRFSVGVMPLDATPWSEGKCGLKLIQYLAAGVPAVASPVGVNRKIIEESDAGFTATTPDEWQQRLVTLLDATTTGADYGAKGRAWALENASIAAVTPGLVRFLQDCSAAK
jgi:glycosyltransferase involved in cell wall biosynthesis